MPTWVQDANCFISRYTVDPARRDEFLGAFADLLTFAGKFYDEDCNFAFHGWGRDPNEWVAIASWKSEEILARLRADPQFQEATLRMLGCCSAPMIMESFAGMTKDRSVFDLYPTGRSRAHAMTREVEVIWK